MVLMCAVGRRRGRSRSRAALLTHRRCARKPGGLARPTFTARATPAMSAASTAPAAAASLATFSALTAFGAFTRNLALFSGSLYVGA